MPLEGLVVPSLTLFAPDGTIDAGKNAAFARRLSERGANHLFALGSMGEFASVGDGERERLLESVIESATGGADVWVGCGAPSTRAAVVLAEQAESLGAAALVAVPPYYLHPSLPAIERYYRALRAATSIPLLAYDIPALVGYALPAPFLHRLGSEGVIAGAKETAGAWPPVEALLAGRPDGFAVLPGDDPLASRAILGGAAGAVMGTANLAPRLASDLVAAAHRGDRSGASDLQGLVDELARAASAGPFPATAKFLLGRFGSVEAGYRSPIDPLSDVEERTVLAALEGAGPRLLPYLKG